MKEWECKQCANVIYLSSEEGEEPHCPFCRGSMKKTGDSKSASELREYTCPDCGKKFFMKKKNNPYKCPFCNHSFTSTPLLKQEEKL